ncbi:Acyl-CoA N-acyltransferase [Cordyceps fumosorosea ARSEF 2679]|uniref:Acyl-CoA N-acyltransferase n=1 Tax=Cordyceps fumosorosea (strain ARSEF 2679) TaxID=1081104 RepID=A0A162MRF7_CORFA|nr:Acyl-CoA N-acyltransferase [Cordyceps fumosorosea ARSEF 2679]OAA69049.1 Acyl-CoA N-acyltransferase [Cordyceps fumosorosea ARSEF 2679]
MSIDFSSVFSSERLIYEPFDNADEDTKKFLYHQMAMNPEIKGLDSIQAFTPLSKTSYYESLGHWKNNLMNVIFCLKPDGWDELSRDYTREEHAKGGLRGVPVGMMCLAALPASLAHHRRAGVGMSVSAAHQGRGYGTEALRWIAGWTFDYGNMHSLFLQTSSLNEKAIHVYKKVGFVEDGREREALYLAGRWFDTVHMSILEQDWRANQGGEKSYSEV